MSEERKTITIDAAKVETATLYKLLIQSVIPRPIAFVTSQGPDGRGNLAPFSFYNGVSSFPPCISVAIARKPDGSKKDTLRNIEDNGEFVVNSASRWLFDAIVQSGAAYPYGTDEREIVGLHTVPSIKIRVPRLSEAAIQMECRLYKSVEVGDGSPGSSTLIIGEIVMFHIDERAYREGKIDPAVIEPVARLGGIGYTLLGERLERAIPQL